MSLLDQYAHGLLTMFAMLVRLVLNALATVEGGLRALTSSAGLGNDVQTLLVIVILAVFLFAGLRLLKGRLRSAVSFVLLVTLAHTFEHLAIG